MQKAHMTDALHYLKQCYVQQLLACQTHTTGPSLLAVLIMTQSDVAFLVLHQLHGMTEQ